MITMDAMECILTRRSIRKYKNKPISEELVQELLNAAMHAPSASNKQPWQFVVIDDRKILDLIPTFHQYSKMLLEAPLAIVVCGDTTIQPLEGYWIQDCSAATQNILLAAHALGLSGVWLGIHPRENRINGIIDLLKLPEHIKPLALIAIGYPDEIKEKPARFDESRIHYNVW